MPLRIIKTVIMGDYMSGKTTIRNFVTRANPDTHYLMGIGADFSMVDVIIDSRNYRIQLWDLAGAAKPKHVRSAYYLGAYAGIVVFDINSRMSFYHVRDWVEDFWAMNQKGPMPVLIIGNKSDLKSQWSASPEMMELLCRTLSDRTAELGFMIHAIETNRDERNKINEALHTLWEEAATYAAKKAMEKPMEEKK